MIWVWQINLRDIFDEVPLGVRVQIIYENDGCSANNEITVKVITQQRCVADVGITLGMGILI